MRNLHHSLCTVIPPHMLRNIAAHGGGDEEVRKGAEGTLDVMGSLGRWREARSLGAGFSVPNGVSSGAAASAGKRRSVYDGLHRQILPGRRVMSEHTRRSADVEVTEAYDGSGITYDFFQKVYGRNSIDGRGLRLESTVHYGQRFDNAFWNGSQMIYGDGDGQLFTRFTIALDVIGHELTHGVTQFSAGFGYRGQNGALNEHISDAFGIMVKQFSLNQVATESDWLIGAGLFTDKVKGKAIRSMAAPGTAYDDPILGRDPQPAHMRDYVVTSDDNGGVHINSGIPNHAFYVAAIDIGGESWSVLGRVWYATLTQWARPDFEFQAFADATGDTAGSLFGVNGHVQQAIRDAWAQVGLPPSHPVAPRIAISGRRPAIPATAVSKHGAAAAPKWRNRPAR